MTVGFRTALCLLAAMAFSAPMLAPRPARAQTNYGTYGTDQHSCDRSALSQVLSTSKENILGTAAGGALGGLLGNQVGKGSGNALATLAGVVGGALAGGYVGRSMQPADQACVATTLQNTPTSQTVAWHDPKTDQSYWVTPTRDYRGSNGEPCRDYITQAVVNGQRQETRGTACMDRSGAWRTVAAGNPPPPPPGPPPYQQGTNYAPPGPAPAPSRQGGGPALSRQMVREIQDRLWRDGYYHGSPDGQWGPQTASALAQFQRSRGLRADGQLDGPTLNALGVGGESGSSATGSR